jgi:hypothetical protein
VASKLVGQPRKLIGGLGFGELINRSLAHEPRLLSLGMGGNRSTALTHHPQLTTRRRAIPPIVPFPP